jgi:hypothetical protein
MKHIHDNFIEKVKKILPTEELRFKMLITLIGMSGVIAEFLMEETIETDRVAKIPPSVRYALTCIAGNMIAFTSDNRSKLMDLSSIDLDNGYLMSEQTQERIYREMKLIVETLYFNLKQEENEQFRHFI